MGNFWKIFALLALTFLCYFFSSVAPIKDTEKKFVEVQESVVSKHVRNHSALLGSLGEKVQRIEQEKGTLASSFKALQTKTLDQAKLIKSQQEQLQSVQNEINATKAKNLNHMDLIKTQHEQLQSMRAEISAMKQQHSEQEGLQSVQAEINATKAKSINQMELIKSQQEQIQNMLAEINAIKRKQSQQADLQSVQAENNATTEINTIKQQQSDLAKPENKSEMMVGGISSESKLQKLLRDGNLHYILGVSTGHAGSTTIQEMLRGQKGCPWDHRGIFEFKAPKERQTMFYKEQQNESDPCAYTRDVLIPFLDQRRKNATWIDAGHFHNRGPILECLASLVGPHIAFVRIRRNRHDIANSFVKEFETPCFPLNEEQEQTHKRNHPKISYCPEDATTPVSLPVNHQTWKKFTPFQQFLWQADELEMRFHKLQTDYPDPQYLELTWSLGEELTEGIHDIRTKLGCQNNFKKIPDMKQHTKKKERGNKNCTNFISQDLEYRTQVQYNDKQKQVLFHRHPQPVNTDECIETREEIEKIVTSSKEWLQHWVYK